MFTRRSTPIHDQWKKHAVLFFGAFGRGKRGGAVTLKKKLVSQPWRGGRVAARRTGDIGQAMQPKKAVNEK